MNHEKHNFLTSERLWSFRECTGKFRLLGESCRRPSRVLETFPDPAESRFACKAIRCWTGPKPFRTQLFVGCSERRLMNRTLNEERKNFKNYDFKNVTYVYMIENVTFTWNNWQPRCWQIIENNLINVYI